MTSQEINEAILRSLGYDNKKDGREVRWHKTEPSGTLVINERLPDFATNLKAIYDAEWELSQEEHERFVVELSDIAGRDYPGEATPEFAVVSACAKQRAEAWLRVRGKWQP